ncbi:uncharacterized protein LOC123223502 [Mangifera indica]|uniref:uncharacterized protein LOC123223502 n=1 Tax=Mangifera indica TaxID=29780 RepID=UPI001CFC22DD|nr:uncharacterized protein LOC123223502 [Mangifera indica]XP_044502595.1 uncharacterized protein LOC123223502 [Mangifera indica]XP_044502596.1 uncharacterized protein LOC123223502 [Mangifera indica]XP_044502597.1 uncharacterized protein LOC123223502 [Mangifera indica]
MKVEKSRVPDVDSEDDNELAEVGCELGMVEGQLCNIPYELYDLPDLREILSMETWNSCLTEEERFFLSAYLPAVDQQTFWLTMKELLGGSDMCFGNPVDIFFKRLKGGFYPRKVASFRECLQFMQRTMYYHSLRSYHDKMVEMFKDMSRQWNQCDMSIGVQERIHTWKTRRKHVSNNLLDLNTVPDDSDLLGDETSSVTPVHHLSKKMKLLSSSPANNIFPSLSAERMKFVTPNCNAKGFLKLKASHESSLQNHNPKLTAVDMSENYRSEPKGLLKVVPRVPSIAPEHSKVMQRQLQSIMLGSGKTLVDGKVSCLPASVFFREAHALGEFPFLQQKVGDGEVQRTGKEPWCVLNQQESAIGISRYSESSTSTRMVTREMNPSSEDAVDLGDQTLSKSNVGRRVNVESESLMDTMGAKRYYFCGTGSKGIPDSPLTNFPFNIQCYEGMCHWQIKPMQQKHKTVNPSFPTVVPRTSNVVISNQETEVSPSSDQIKGQIDVRVRSSEKLFGKPIVSEGLKNEPVFPLTYKRRKSQVKHNSFNFGKPLTAGADLNSASSK